MTESPQRCCDLVMKGGVTSGVLYPAAVQEIAKKFHLVGIGGTSAGAIAACAAAAAEYRRRQTGSMAGFDMLEEISDDLRGPGALIELFRPDRETRRDFAKLMKVKDGKAGPLTFAGLFLRRKKILRRLVGNGFGLCTGMANGNVRPDAPSLTPWLTELIDRIAGKTDAPLSFRDLHEAAIPAGVTPLAGAPMQRSIDLRAVTTCITFGRPVELPFTENIFAFDPREWARLFPARIVDHLVAAAADIDSTRLKREGKLPLPNRDLPVVVAARMSLSFPLLFSMVPLWSVDYHQTDKPLNRIWFSDGGITSNFPLHRFDSLLPRWPTIGINLQYTDDSRLPQRHRLRRDGGYVYLADDRSDVTLDLWNAFDREPREASRLLGADGSRMLGLIGGIFRSAQSWHDNAFLKLSGYRDRVAEIWLTPDEGGLNLDMQPATIDRLVERGRQAGREAAARFADLDPHEAMSWDGHRWTRYRSAMAGLMEALSRFRRATGSAVPESTPLEELLASLDRPPAYRFDSNAQRNQAEAIHGQLLALIAAVDAAAAEVCKEDPLAGPFCDGPRPPVDIGSRARF